jgi:hypothetical protein
MTFAFAAAALLLAGPPRFLGPPEKKPAEGEPAPLAPGDVAPFFFGPVANAEAAGMKQFNLADLVGRRVAASSPAKAVLLGFFCGKSRVSRKELAVLQSLYAQYKSRGLEVVSLAADPAGLLKTRAVAYPVVEDRDGAVARRYLGPKPRYPALVIVARDGTVVSVRTGYRDPVVLLRSEVESALR